MKSNVHISGDGTSTTVRIPLKLQARGGRKTIVGPAGSAAWRPLQPKVDNAILKALGRAWRWKQMAESGEFNTLAEIAKADGVNFSYVCRVLRLTLLAPMIIQTLLDGKQKPDTRIQSILKPLPTNWAEQEQRFDLYL